MEVDNLAEAAEHLLQHRAQLVNLGGRHDGHVVGDNDVVQVLVELGSCGGRKAKW